MKTLLSYVRTNQSPIEESSPLAEADFACFSWLSYFNYPPFLKTENIPLSSLEENSLLPRKEMYAPSFNPKASHRFYNYLLKSHRFSSVSLSDFHSTSNPETPMQFAAITVHLNEKIHIISFRGTDATFIGWAEDFSLSYEKEIGSYPIGLDYIRKVMGQYEGDFYFTGHSKGGNVLIYCFHQLEEQYQKRIKGVYTFDNPGFKEISLPENKIIHKFIPASSFVGMFFQDQKPEKIVKSRNVSLFQHDVFSWLIDEKGNFLQVKRENKQRFRLAKGFNNWVNGLTIEERKRFTTLLFDGLNQSSLKDFMALFSHLVPFGIEINKIYSKLPKEDKFFIRRVIKDFFASYHKTKQVT